MKKIFFSAALAAMMMASCQNENLVNSNEMQEEFTVEVTKGTDSRVAMKNGSPVWSADDALYVYGTNGVRGTLYLTSGADSKTATFTGVISGSSKNLTNAIFGNVEHNGDEISLTLSNVDASQCDAPMFGAFSADKGSISLDYICGLVPVTIDGIDANNTVKLGGYGVSTLSLVDGEWVPGTAYADITLTNVPDGETFYVPFFTTEEESKTPLTITVDGESYTYLADTKAGGITSTTAPELTFDENGELSADPESESTQPSIFVVANQEELNAAIDNGEHSLYLLKGEYIIPGIKNKKIKIIGTRDEVLINKIKTSHNNDYYSGSELSFEDVTLIGGTYSGSYNGYIQAAKEDYIHCTFDTFYMFAGDVVTVTECDFKNMDGQYIWTGSAGEITFSKCNFNGVDRAVKVHTVGNKQNEARIVTFKECKFSATEKEGEIKAALEGASSGEHQSYIINIEDSSMSGEFTKWFNVGEAYKSDYVLNMKWRL